MTMMMLTSGGKLPANDHRPGQFWLIRPPPVIGLAPCPTNIIKNTPNRVSKHHYIALCVQQCQIFPNYCMKIAPSKTIKPKNWSK